MLKKQKRHITQLLSVFMLMVFALALTPWNLFHHHKRINPVAQETNCHHLSHLESHADECLICYAGFEKNYVNPHQLYKIFLSAKIFGQFEPLIKSSYVEVKHTCLRGPPLA